MGFGSPLRFHKFVKRSVAFTAFLLVAFVCSLLGFSCASNRSVEIEIASTSRDPDTGIILGTEAIDLGAEDAPAACLLLHGFVGSRIDYADLGERLSEKGLFVRMARLPGHGTTPRDLAEVSAEEVLAGARAELHDLQQRFDRVYLVGFSMGGAVATVLASEFPAASGPSPGPLPATSVDRLVLISPFYAVTYYWYYVLPPSVWNRMFSRLIHYVPKGPRFIKVNRRESVPSMFSYDNVPTHAASMLDELGKMASAEATLQQIDVPMLLLHSWGDEAADPKAAQKVFDQISSADKEIHFYDKRSNHHLMWDYDSEDVMRRVVEFLAEPQSEPQSERKTDR